MNITRHLLYLRDLIKDKDVDDVITDDVFAQFVYYIDTLDFVVVNESYFYENGYNQVDEYTFEDFDDLMDGIVQIVPNSTVQVIRHDFVTKLQECMDMYYLISEIDNI